MTEANPTPTDPHSSPPSSASPLSKHTEMTTPDRQPSPPPPPQDDPQHTNTNNLDDIWASDSPPSSPRHHPHPHPAPESRPNNAHNRALASAQPREELLSDLPSLRRQHMTAGYREGLGIGKARVMQGGFDAGYPLGVSVGLRVGRVLGVLEGLCAGKRREGGGIGEGGSGSGVDREGEVREEVEKLLGQARRELGRGVLLEGLDEEVLVRATVVPERVDGVLREWEKRVLGAEGLGVDSAEG